MTETFKQIKWMNVVLFFSLAVNFFVAGYLVSNTTMLKNLHHRAMSPGPRPEIRILDYFPDAEKEKFHHMLSKNRELLRPLKRNIFEQQKVILSILSAENIDEAKLRQAFDDYEKTEKQLQLSMNEIVLTMVLDMDYDTRRQMVERGVKAHEHRKTMRLKKEDDMPPRTRNALIE
ncbi:MAG: periplasmic heavy metal sensor [Emcibacter sp.]|nr:periplasmic heavy metal sensor [Emcibacter sp.]